MQLLWTTKAFLPYMLERKKGHIVVTGSVGSFVGLPSKFLNNKTFIL